MRARFIYRDGKFWFRVFWVDLGDEGVRNNRYEAGPFASLSAAWDARFGS